MAPEATTDEDEGTEITYQFSASSDLWYRWRETLGHRETIADRLLMLIESDARRNDIDLDGPDDLTQADRDTISGLLRFNAVQALADARRSGADDATERCQKIIELADALAESPD